MKTPARYIARVLALSVVASVTACGGGGGGDPGPKPPTQLAINNTNAPTVAGAAIQAAGSSATLGPTGAAIIGGVSVNNETTSTGLVEFALWQLTALSKLPSHQANLIGAVLVSGTEPCTDGGSFSYSFDDADLNGDLSVGETFSATFNNCVISPGVPASGSMTLVMSSLVGTPGTGAWSGALTMTFADFNVSGEHVSGDITVALSTDDSSNISATLSGSSLSLTNSTGKTSKITGYTLAMTYNNVTNAYALSASADTLTRSDFDGSVSFSTPTAFSGNFANSPENPTSGILVVTGANGSKVKLTAIDNTVVELAVDANGDGTYESTSNMTWDAIDAL